MLESKTERHGLFMRSARDTVQNRLTKEERRDVEDAAKTLMRSCSIDKNLALEIIAKYGISLTDHQVPQTKKDFQNLVSSKP